jgi:hypothetical protein
MKSNEWKYQISSSDKVRITVVDLVDLIKSVKINTKFDKISTEGSHALGSLYER